MKSIRWFLAAGGWLLAIWLAFRVAGLEQRLHDAGAGIANARAERRTPLPRASAPRPPMDEVQSVRQELAATV